MFMKRNGFTKGVITGALISAAAIMMIDPINDKNRNNIRKSAGRFLKNAGNVVENFMDFRR